MFPLKNDVIDKRLRVNWVQKQLSPVECEMATNFSSDSAFSPPSSKRARLSLEDGDRARQTKKAQSVASAAASEIKLEFPLRNLEDFYKDCPTYRLPVEVGSFSLDNQGKQQLDRTQLRYYFSPPAISSRLNFDLKVGYDKFVPSPRSVPSDKLNPILRWIAMNGDCFRPKPFSPKSPDKAQDGRGGGGAGKELDPMGRRVSVGEVVTSMPTSPSKDRYVQYSQLRNFICTQFHWAVALIANINILLQT